MSEMGSTECRFCLKTINDGEFDIIGEKTKQKLDTLLLKLNLDVRKNAVICSKCATKLQIAWDFKSTCLNAQPKFLPFNTQEENAKEDILNKNVTEQLTENQKLCRFCMKMTKIGCYTDLQEKKENVFILDMVQKHIPELSLITSDEIISCELCHNSLQNLLGFVTVCFEVEEKVKGSVEEITVKCQLKQNDSKYFTVNSNDYKDVDVSKIEKIKEEKEISSVKIETLDEDIREIQHAEINIKDETESLQAFPSPDKEDASTHSQETYKCNSCPYRTRLERLLKKHTMIHEDLSGVTAYKCDKCLYVTDRKYYLENHTFTHRDSSEIKLYKCGKSSYETRHESGLVQHVETHQRTPEIKMYYCNNCSFRSKYRRNLRQHVLTHRDVSELQIYKCHRCLYGSNRKSQLKRHMLIHQDISEVTSYKCEFEGCSYVAKRRDCIKSHMVTHKISSEIYKCNHCEYESRNKKTLYIHTRNHHNLSGTQIYQCGVCMYETTCKSTLRTHIHMHGRTSRKHIHECGRCKFKTKSVVNFKRHQLIHRELPEVGVYKCGRCMFETNHEVDLAQHMLTHSELVVIKTEVST